MRLEKLVDVVVILFGRRQLAGCLDYFIEVQEPLNNNMLCLLRLAVPAPLAADAVKEHGRLAREVGRRAPLRGVGVRDGRFIDTGSENEHTDTEARVQCELLDLDAGFPVKYFVDISLRMSEKCWC